MKVLFVGTSGVHQALVAAHLFLGNYNLEDVTSSPYFANIQMERAGSPIYVGTKKRDQDVYVLGVGPEVKMAEKTLKGLIGIWGFDKSNFAIISINIKGERVIAFASRLPHCLRFVHIFIVKAIIKVQLDKINRQVNIG